MEVRRQAKIFEAADYEERGLSFTEADLDGMVSGFNEPVPVMVEHIESPLRLGWLTRVWRIGKDLYGELAFTANAWGLLAESAARRLSVGLDRLKEGWRVVEVSLVQFPRVEDAQIYRSRTAPRVASFAFDIADDGQDSAVSAAPAADRAGGTHNTEDISMAEATERVVAREATFTRADVEQMLAEARTAQEAAFSEKLEVLQAAFRTERAADRVRTLVSAGVICETQAQAAHTLFAAGGAVAEAFGAFLDGAAAGNTVTDTTGAQDEPDGAAKFGELDLKILQALGVSPEDAGKAMVS